MTDTVTLYYVGFSGSIQIGQENDPAVSLTNSGTNVIYSGNSVNLIEAELDSPSLTLTLTPNNGVSVFQVATLAARPNDETIATGGLSWQPSGNGVQLVFTTPSPTSGYEIEWLLNEEQPPIRLTVKIKRR